MKAIFLYHHVEGGKLKCHSAVYNLRRLIICHCFLIDQQLKRQWRVKIWRDIMEYFKAKKSNIFGYPLSNISIQPLPA